MKDSIVSPSLSDLLKKVDDKFSLVIFSARVARYNIEKEKDIKNDKYVNYLTRSVRQIYEDKVSYEMIDVE